jgi:iron complex transport system substrate-binding protein
MVLGVQAAAAEYPFTATDDGGTPVTLPAKPVHIVSLTLFTDEVLLELVEPSRLAAVTSFSVDPAISNVAARAARVPNKLTMNVEVLVALKPDLVLAANWTEADRVKQLREAGVPVYLIGTGTTVDGIQAKIARLGRLVGEPAKAAKLVDAMNARLAAVAERVAAVPADRRLSVVDYTVWGAAQGTGSSWDEIVRRAGLVNGVGNIAADRWGQVPLSKERLLEIDPDILILPGWTYDDPRGSEAFFAKTVADPVLRALKAVRGGRAYRMPENLKTTTSQYIVDAVEWLARTAYPDLFR